MKKLILALCFCPGMAFADEAFDKDVGYCVGLSASLLEAQPTHEGAQNAVKALQKLVEDKQNSMDVKSSQQTAYAYNTTLQQVRGSVPDTENEKLAILVDMGLKSCEKIGVQIFTSTP